MNTGNKTITGATRIALAFSHQKGDRLPVFDVMNNPQCYVKYLGTANRDSKGIPAVQLARYLGMDATMVQCAPYTCLIPPNRGKTEDDTFTDRFGLVCRITDTSWPLGMPIGPVEDPKLLLDRLKKAVVTDDDVEQAGLAAEEARNGTDKIAVFGGVRSAFSFLMITLGIENLTILLYEEPKLLQALVAESTRYWTEIGLRLIHVGCDALYVANDMGMNGSTLIAPKQLQEFFFPFLAQEFSAYHAANGKTILHSCGNIDSILPDLAAMQITGITNIQARAGMDLASVKARYGDKWTIIGNVDATETMTSKRKEDIAEALQKVIDTAGSDGGLILATDHSFHMGIPVENIEYFIGKAKELGSFRSACKHR
jgi:uroporphyrinogen-III decarboxylase